MKKFLFSLMAIFCLLGLGVSPVTAQTYKFKLVTSVVNIIINQDGTASIDYVLDFANNASASPLDAVDIGMPNDQYELSSVQAEVNGQSVSNITDSPYVKPGIAVNLGSLAIAPGATGRVHVYIGKVKGLLHPGTQQESEKYASFQFSPTWFGSEYVSGTTDMSVTLTVPQNVKSNEPRYFPPKNWPGTSAPMTGLDSKNRPYYQWHSTSANGSTQYTFGAAFPARVVPASAVVAAPLVNFNINFDDLCCGGFFLIFFGIMGLITWVSVAASRKRKLQYMPPSISVEGHGIKRGLTAVEAAVLMEQPPDRVFTMILFSVVKKGAATVVSREPLKVQTTQPLPPDLRAYETDFLSAFESANVVGEKRALQNTLVNLIKSVTEKMKGFSRKETVDYYKDINEKAWQMIKTANTPDVQAKTLDEALDWSMMSDNYNQRAQEAFAGRPVYVPMWWGHYDPTFHPMGSSLGGSSMPSVGSAPVSVSLPNLPGSDFAASMVNGVQNFSSSILGDVGAFTGAVTDKTNPVPVSQSSYHGGGGGCACACACAGCACACAGGGR